MCAVKPSLLLPLALALLGACGDDGAATSGDDLLPTQTERGAFRVQIELDAQSFRRGVNAMTVRAATPSGEGAQLVSVRARMPGHAHDESVGTPRAVNGAWRVDALELAMAGRWEVVFRFAQGSTQDEAIAVTQLR